MTKKIQSSNLQNSFSATVVVVIAVQPAVDERSPIATSIAQKHPNLAILDSANSAAVQASNTSRVQTFLQKASFINDTNSIISQVVGDIAIQAVAQRISVPIGTTEEVLKAIRIVVTTDFGELPTILALGKTVQSR